MTNIGARLRLVAAGCLLLAVSAPVSAQDDRWGVSFSLGLTLPSLDDVDNGLYQSPFIGTGTVLVSEGSAGGVADGADANETETIPFRYENSLGSAEPGTYGGIEFTWHPNDRHALILGFGSVESVTTTTTIGNIPVQQYFVSNIVESNRRGKLSYNEYQIGWQYTMVRNDVFRLYSRLSVHEAFDIDYREEWTFLFTESPIDDLIGVRRNMTAEAETASLFMGQIGLGGEWMLLDWFALGVEAGYLFGEREFSLQDVEIKDDFTAGDSLSRVGLPYREMPDGTLGFLNPSATIDDLEDPSTRDDFYTPIRLKFDGWRIGFRVTFYF